MARPRTAQAGQGGSVVLRPKNPAVAPELQKISARVHETRVPHP